MPNSKTPILITAFNRFESFKTVLEIVLIKYKKIYISIDGPRNLNDKKEQDKITKYINKKKNINIKIRRLKKNHGCQKAVIAALDWLFRNEKKGIILEDDLIPKKDFFNFCEKNLLKFEKNKKIFSICGFNPLDLQLNKKFIITKYFMCWGWATWKDRWLIAKKNFKSENGWLKLQSSKNWENSALDQVENKYFKKIFKKITSKEIDSWAYLWLLIGISNSSKFIVSTKNLVQNNGLNIFGANNVPLNSQINNRKVVKFKKIISQNKPNKDLERILFYNAYNPERLFYPYRLLYIFKKLIFDPKFFFSKSFQILTKVLKF